MSSAAKRSSRTNSSTDTTTDNRQATEQVFWDGGQTKQATWFNSKLKSASRVYDYRQLWETGTFVIPRTGKIAVFSAEYAGETVWHDTKLPLTCMERHTAKI